MRHRLITFVPVLVWAIACAATPLLSQSGTAPDSRMKPVSFAILEDYDKGDPLLEVEADIALFKELEIATWRGSIGWDDFEPSRGEYDFEWLRAFASLADRHGITLRPYIGYTPEWAARPGGSDADVWNNPPARLEDWERFAAALGRTLRNHRNVASYEIYTGENVTQWWDGTPEAYADVLRSGSRALRAAHPGAPIVFGGLVSPDREWIERVCGLGTGASFNVLPVHAYPETRTPPDVTVENYLGGLAGFVEAADRSCGRKPIWVNETGFATVPGKSEREQAIWWVRAVATFLASPRVEHIGIYEIKDLATDRPAIGDAPSYHLGLARVDRTRKLAFHTIDLLTDLLDTGTIAVDDAALDISVVEGTAGELHHHLFTRPDGDRVLILWDRTAGPAVRLRIERIGASVEFDVDGRPLNWDDSASVLERVKLSPGVPRIFRLAFAPPD
jgi:hypothetical protein